MTDLQKMKMKRNVSVIKYLKSHLQIIENDNSFKHFYEKLIADHQRVLGTQEELLQDKVIQNHDKTRLKKEVCTLASTLSETATKVLDSLGQRGWYSEVKVWYMHFSRATDIVTEERLRMAYKLLKTNSSAFAPDEITAEQLAELKTKIDEFANTPGSSLQRDRISPEETVEFKANLKLTEIDIRYILEAAKKYKDTATEFYEGLVTLCTLPEEAQPTSTTINFTITDSDTGLPLPNVLCSLDKSEENPISDEEGQLNYTKTKAGRGIATFTKKGYEENVIIVKIKAATANTFEVTMQRI